MPGPIWTFTDHESRTYVDELHLTGEQLGSAARDCQVHKRRLRGGLSDGVDLVEIFNGAMQIAVLPTRGMGLWRIRQQAGFAPLTDPHHGSGIELGWRSPVEGPVHPAFVPLFAPDGLGWLHGFDELLVRCGLESNGAPDFDSEGRLVYPLHGKIANRPAQRVELSVDESGGIQLQGTVDEARLFFSKLRLVSTVKVWPGELRVDIIDEVTNLSADPGGMQLLYHINVGPPLLEPGSKLVVPARTIAPRDGRAAEGIGQWDTYGPEEPGFAEQAYFFEPLADDQGRSRALLHDAAGQAGASVHFNREQLPRLIQWKSTQPLEDGYVTGIEPAVNFPNPRTFEANQGRVLELQPGETRRFELALEIHPDAESVAEAKRHIAQLQGDTLPTIHDTPLQGWSPL